MIVDLSFGTLFRTIRIKNKETLRQYCLKRGFDSGNISKMERNIFPPPFSMKQLIKYLNGMECSDLELNLLITAAQNYYLSQVISRWKNDFEV